MTVPSTAGASSEQRMVGRRELEPRVDRTATGPLAVVPMTLAEANALVGRLHRHHQPVPGAKFCIGIADGSGVRGVAVVGRPVSRHADDGWTLEVNRVCTDGVKNGCSMLYGAAWRAARAMGYRKLITYTLPEEGGVSLKAAGWRMVGEAGGGKWSRGSRPRVDDAPTQIKWRWEAGDGNGESNNGAQTPNKQLCDPNQMHDERK